MRPEKDHQKFSSLAQLRDELAVQAHLFSLELKDEWSELEKRWGQLQSDAKSVQNSIKEAQSSRSEAIARLSASLEQAYRKFRSHLR